jgi:y4mF family transcriptional regulator
MKNNRNNDIAVFIRKKRKEYNYTQQEFSIRSGLGLRFIRELEQGKITLKMDKVAQALEFFGYQLTVRMIDKDTSNID